MGRAISLQSVQVTREAEMKKETALKLSAILIILLGGCTTVTQTIYVQNVKVDGPINQPPIHVTDKNQNESITISPKFYLNTTNTQTAGLNHTNVNRTGNFQVDTVFNSDGTWSYKVSNTNTYQFKGRNLSWNLPSLYAGLDVDLPMSRRVSISGSFNFSNQEDINLVGGSVGLGFNSQNKNSTMRIDVGLTFQEYWYDAATVVVTETQPAFGDKTTVVSFFRDTNKNTSINPYISVTYNSDYEKSPVNFYLGLSYFGQTLFDYEPQKPDPIYYPFTTTTVTSDTYNKVSTAYVGINPGIYTKISDNSRIMFGVSILKNLEMENPSFRICSGSA